MAECVIAFLLGWVIGTTIMIYRIRPMQLVSLA